MVATPFMRTMPTPAQQAPRMMAGTKSLGLTLCSMPISTMKLMSMNWRATKVATSAETTTGASDAVV
ncbi:hypothetical protein D3C87_2087350 [compost metagenome]